MTRRSICSISSPFSGSSRKSVKIGEQIESVGGCGKVRGAARSLRGAQFQGREDLMTGGVCRPRWIDRAKTADETFFHGAGGNLAGAIPVSRVAHLGPRSPTTAAPNGTVTLFHSLYLSQESGWSKGPLLRPISAAKSLGRVDLGTGDGPARGTRLLRCPGLQLSSLVMSCASSIFLTIVYDARHVSECPLSTLGPFAECVTPRQRHHQE